MTLDHDDHIALRAAEQAVLGTTTRTDARPRRGYARALKNDASFDADRLDALALAGYLQDLEGDRDANPARGRRRLVVTEAGRREWRCAAAEDLALAMRMDDLFHRDGDFVVTEVRDGRVHPADEPHPELTGPEWSASVIEPDPEDPSDETCVHYVRQVRVDALANRYGERLRIWNPTPNQYCETGRFGPHSTGRTIPMTPYIMIALDAAINHRVYYGGGHTHIQTRCGSRGWSASSDARNILLRFRLIEACAPDCVRRTEDYRITPLGRVFHARVMQHLHEANDADARIWRDYQARMATPAAA